MSSSSIRMRSELSTHWTCSMLLLRCSSSSSSTRCTAAGRPGRVFNGHCCTSLSLEALLSASVVPVHMHTREHQAPAGDDQSLCGWWDITALLIFRPCLTYCFCCCSAVVHGAARTGARWPAQRAVHRQPGDAGAKPSSHTMQSHPTCMHANNVFLFSDRHSPVSAGSACDSRPAGVRWPGRSVWRVCCR